MLERWAYYITFMIDMMARIPIVLQMGITGMSALIDGRMFPFVRIT